MSPSGRGTTGAGRMGRKRERVMIARAGRLSECGVVRGEDEGEGGLGDRGRLNGGVDERVQYTLWMWMKLLRQELRWTP